MIYRVGNQWHCSCGQEVEQNDLLCKHCGDPTLVSIEVERENVRRDKVNTTFEEMMRCCNTMFDDDNAKIMLNVIMRSHRTSQANFWRTIQLMAKHYQNAPNDLRNEAAVKFCKEISKIDQHIPFV
jgi:hypothetical protein